MTKKQTNTKQTLTKIVATKLHCQKKKGGAHSAFNKVNTYNKGKKHRLME